MKTKEERKWIVPLIIFILILLILGIGTLVLNELNKNKTTPTQEQFSYAKKFDNTFNPPKNEEEYKSFLFTNMYGGYEWGVDK